jgi:hypothetical protein
LDTELTFGKRESDCRGEVGGLQKHTQTTDTYSKLSTEIRFVNFKYNENDESIKRIVNNL